MSDVLGIDIGGSLIKAIVSSPDGTVRERAVEPSPVAEGPEPTLERVVELARRLRDVHPFRCVGLGICGPVDHANGGVSSSPILPGWGDVALVKPLVDRLEMPVCLENDAACAILGEWWLGSGEGRPIVAGLTLGTGIGGGLVIEGDIYRGSGSWGAEFGHVAVADGPPCPCGGSGCVNELASVTATLKRYRQLSGVEIDDFEELLRRSGSGQDDASEALRVSVDYLSRAVRTLLNALNPDVFVLAGGMAQWGDSLRQAVQSQIQGTTFAGLDRTPIHVARLGLFSGATGAARLATS